MKFKVGEFMNLLVKDRNFYKTFFILTLSISAQNLIVFSVNLADNIMLGGYSETALSGVALVNQIQFFLQMLTMGIGEGVVVLCAQYWGKRNIEPIKKIISVGLLFGIVTSICLLLIMFCFPYEVLHLMTNDEVIIAEGVKYLKIICFTYLFFSITNIMIASLRSVEIVKIGFIVSISTLIVNVCLNYILIYGHFGAPRLGVQGAAIATLIARIIELIIVIIFVKFYEHRLKLNLKELLKLDITYLHDYIRVASPVIISNSLWGFAMAVQTAILGHMGASAIAANSIATIVFQILSVVVYGSSNASSIIIGKTVGEGDLKKLKGYVKTLQILFVIIGLCTGFCLFIIKDLILNFYSVSEATKLLARQFINVLSITSIGTAYQMAALTGIVRSGGDTKFVLINDMIFMWLIVIPSAALSAFYFGFSPVIVFICLKSDQILKCFVAVIKVNRYKWVRQLTRSE